MPTPEEVAKYCPEKADKYNWWLKELEQNPQRQWMADSWMESVNQIAQARKDRETLKQALISYVHSGPIGFSVLDAEEVLASINKDSNNATA